MAETDRRTTIDGDQITDDTISSSELLFDNSETDDNIVGVDSTSKNFKYLNFPVFGQNFQETSSLTISSTTSSSFQQKLRMTTETLPIGKYRLGWSYSWQYGLVSNDFKARIQFNDDKVMMEHQEEPKDQYSNQERYCTGFLYFSVASEQSINIDLDYCSNSGAQADIFNAKLEIWRVE